jgi:hypothetical protein
MYRLAYLLLSITIPALGQEVNDFVSCNKVTYELYTQKKWDDLILVGKEALKNNFDFFYLRARMGIAYYEKGNHAKAINHLQKALEFNDSDPIILEYLYFSYIFSNRYQEASRLYYKYFQIFNTKELSIKPKVFDYLDIQGGLKLSDHHTELGLEANNITYGYLGATLNFKGRFFLYQNVGLLSHGFTDKYIYQGFLYRYQFYYRQFEYYVSGNLLVGKGWFINPAYRFLRVDVISQKYNDYYYGLSINKNFNKVRLGINVSKAYIIDTDVFQIVPEITYYPLGNAKLCFTIQNTYNKSDENDPFNHFLGKIGLKIVNKSWLEGFYGYGKVKFLSFNNGFVVYNRPDYLLSRGGAYFYQYFTNNTCLFLSYQLENIEQLVSEDLYSNHVIMAGINIKF